MGSIWPSFSSSLDDSSSGWWKGLLSTLRLGVGLGAGLGACFLGGACLDLRLGLLLLVVVGGGGGAVLVGAVLLTVCHSVSSDIFLEREKERKRKKIETFVLIGQVVLLTCSHKCDPSSVPYVTNMQLRYSTWKFSFI